jgi:hypothetical protein
VVGVLSHLEETKNRALYVQDMTLSQNRILRIVRKLAPSKRLEPVYTNTVKIEKLANERVAKGDLTIDVMYEYLTLSIFGEGTGGLMAKTDNKLLGVLGDKTDADVEAILRPLLAAVN